MKKTVLKIGIGFFCFLCFLYFNEIMLIFHSSPQKVAIHQIQITPKSKMRVLYYHYQTNQGTINGFASVPFRFIDKFQVGDSVWIEYSTIFDRVSRICEAQLKHK